MAQGFIDVEVMSRCAIICSCSNIDYEPLLRRRELLRGPLYYVLVLIAATLVFWRDSPVRRPMPCPGSEVLMQLSAMQHRGGKTLSHSLLNAWRGPCMSMLGACQIISPCSGLL